MRMDFGAMPRSVIMFIRGNRLQRALFGNSTARRSRSRQDIAQEKTSSAIAQTCDATESRTCFCLMFLPRCLLVT